MHLQLHGTASHAEIQTLQLRRQLRRQGAGAGLADAAATEGQLQVAQATLANNLYHLPGLPVKPVKVVKQRHLPI